jgi:hypothetical protein
MYSANFTPDTREKNMNCWIRIIFYTAGACLAALDAECAELQPGDRDLAWVEKRVQELEPAARDRRIDEIGWASDIRQAERLAGEHNRPVFLFTHDGHINTGRC